MSVKLLTGHTPNKVSRDSFVHIFDSQRFHMSVI